ncbi:MAG: S8 family serine peptidase [Bacteroidota bacterium]
MQIKIFFTSFFLFIGILANLQGQKLDHVPGEILVRFKEGVNPKAWTLSTAQLRTQMASPEVKRCVSDHFKVWTLNFDWRTTNERTLLAAVRQDPQVVAAQFNHFIELRSKTPNDPRYGEQWYLNNTGQRTGFVPGLDLGMEEAWELSTGGVTPQGDTIVVCVIDNGLDLGHEDFEDNVWVNHNEIPDNGLDDDNNGYIDDYRGWHVARGNDNVDDQNWHGTLTAGIIGAKGNNGIGVTGINWDVKLMIVVGGFGQAVESRIIEAYEYCLVQRKLYNETDGERGAFVVASNSSWGVARSFPDEYPLWCAVYDSLGQEGVLNIGATDNKNVNVDSIGDMPTSCESEFLISVTNVGGDGKKIVEAGYGLKSIDLGAYGDQITVTGDGNTYTEDGGTSFAAPMVTGAVALLYAANCPTLSALYQENPQNAALLVKDALLRSVDLDPSLDGLTVTGGRLNIKNALDLLLGECGDCPPLLQIGPQNLTDTQADITWLGNELVERVDFRWRQTGESDWQELINTSSPIQFDNLLACTSYEYQLRTFCASDTVEYDRIFAFTTDGCCDAPEDLSPAFIGQTSMLFNWEPILAARSYTLRYRALGTTDWTERFSPVDSRSIQELTPCTTYEFQLQSECTDETSPFSNSLMLTTLGCGACIDEDYCTPSDLSNTNSESEWIAGVSLNTLVNNSETGQGYSDFTGLESPELVLGDTFRMVLTPGFSGFGFDEYFKVWIDFDQDGFFSSRDVVYDTENVGNAVVDTTIIVPEDAIIGKTRMRVIMKFNTEPSSCVSSTSDFFGEVEDYCVTIRASVVNKNRNILEQNTQMTLFPNPTNENFFVKLRSNEVLQAGQVEALDLQGRVVWRQVQNRLPKGKIQFEIPSQDWLPGVYFIRLRNQEGSLVRKLIKTQ